jgi:uncharacterized membrane protein YeiH
MNGLSFITYLGTFIFAITGALKARTYQMDLFGALVLAFVTAYGGGTVRDVLIGIRPVSWLNDYIPLLLVVAAVVLVFVLKEKAGYAKRTIFITDAIGLGLFTVLGIQKSLEAGINSGYTIIMGAISATFGGFLADIISNKVPDMLKRGELYATACLVGGFTQVVLAHNDVAEDLNLGICIVIVVGIRIVSKWKRIYLPEI